MVRQEGRISATHTHTHIHRERERGRERERKRERERETHAHTEAYTVWIPVTLHAGIIAILGLYMTFGMSTFSLKTSAEMCLTVFAFEHLRQEKRGEHADLGKHWKDIGWQNEIYLDLDQDVPQQQQHGTWNRRRKYSVLDPWRVHPHTIRGNALRCLSSFPFSFQAMHKEVFLDFYSFSWVQKCNISLSVWMQGWNSQSQYISSNPEFWNKQLNHGCENPKASLAQFPFPSRRFWHSIEHCRPIAVFWTRNASSVEPNYSMYKYN